MQTHEGEIDSRDFKRLSEVFDVTARELPETMKKHPELTGLPSGIKQLDSLIGGFLPGSLTLVAGRPRSGKSILLSGLSQHIALWEDKSLAFFTLEMSAGQLAQRMLCSAARISIDRLNTGNLSEHDYQRLNGTLERFKHADLWIDDTPLLSIDKLLKRIDGLTRETHLDAVVLDSLQLLSGSDDQSRHEAVVGFARALKTLARELHIPVIAASHIRPSVDYRPNKRPELADLRESGALGDVADLVIALYREEVYDSFTENPATVELNVLKSRHDYCSCIRLLFLEHFGRIGDLP